MQLKPVSLRVANEFVKKHHRHHKQSRGHKFSISLADDDDNLIGVAIVGRPVNRNLDDGRTAEVVRCCTDGTKNACSMLYSASARAAKAMGYKKIITYILDSEPGTSLLASGWERGYTVRGRSWSCPSRPRSDKHPLVNKVFWSKQLQRGKML